MDTSWGLSAVCLSHVFYAVVRVVLEAGGGRIAAAVIEDASMMGPARLVSPPAGLVAPVLPMHLR
jgi:hypothetical protein